MKKSRGLIAMCACAPLLAVPLAAPAWASPTTDSGRANVSVSRNGTPIVQKGTAFAQSTPGSMAVATGPQSFASTNEGGAGNRAIATGGGSTALAGNGSKTNTDNTAIATNGGQAFAGGSNNPCHGCSGNTAIANGPGSTATAGTDNGIKNNNTAHATNGQTVTVG